MKKGRKIMLLTLLLKLITRIKEIKLTDEEIIELVKQIEKELELEEQELFEKFKELNKTINNKDNNPDKTL